MPRILTRAPAKGEDFVGLVKACGDNDPMVGRRHTYIVEIFSACNLRCGLCPRGNYQRGKRTGGKISPELFEQVAAKIARTTPGTMVYLFNWGEPLLHSQLPLLASCLRRHKLQMGLSSNLNVECDFEPILREGCSLMTISASGFTQEVYSKMHIGGDIEAVKGNMRKLSACIRQHQLPVPVQVVYHMYVHNVGDDFDRMRDLCRELGFKFVPTWGYLMPVEKLIECLTHGVADCDRPAVDAMAVPPQRAQAICRPYAAGDCDLRKYQTSINVDGTVDVCCASYDDEHGLGVSFLDKEFDELQRLKYSHPFCRQCMATAAHRIATYNHVGKWNRAAAERLQGLPRDRRQATMAEVLVRYARRMLARALRF